MFAGIPCGPAGAVLAAARSGLAVMGLVLTASAAGAESPTPPDFVDAATWVPGLVVEIRYAGDDNFVGRPIEGYERPRCLLAKAAATALAAVQNDLAGEGLGLKVFDCYRPARAVAHFVRWARDLDDTARKDAYYPGVDKRDLFRLGYIAERSGHSRGSTVDLTLVERASGRERDMGTPFDLFGPRSSHGHAGLTADQRAHRRRLRAAMERRGFAAYEREWWHYGLRTEPYPRTFFDVPVR